MQGKGIPPLAVSREHRALGMAVRETRARRGMTKRAWRGSPACTATRSGRWNAVSRRDVLDGPGAQKGLRVALSDLVEVYERQLADAG